MRALHPIRWPLLLIAATPIACGPSQGEVKRRQDEAQYHYKLAYGYFVPEGPSQAGNVDAAQAELMKSLEVDPENPDAHMLQGLIHMGRERWIDAATSFERAIALKPEFYEAQNNLGACLLAMERWDDAIVVFEKLVSNQLYTTPGHGLNNLGWAWYRKGNLEKARTYFSNAMAMNPKLCPAYNNLGMVYLDQSDPDRAEKELKKAIQFCPGYAEPHFHLGRVLAKRRLPDEARARFQECIRLSGTNSLADRCQGQLALLDQAGGGR